MRPFRTTLVFGVLCAGATFTMHVATGGFYYRSLSLSLLIWAMTAVYGLLLCRWAGKNPVSLFFPLLALLLPVFALPCRPAFWIMCLTVFGWIRSGVCFPGNLLKTFAAELPLTLGGGALIAVFSPRTPLSWALAVWMFFLIQSLFFAFFQPAETPDAFKIAVDPFESARAEAEKIIASNLYGK